MTAHETPIHNETTAKHEIDRAGLDSNRQRRRAVIASSVGTIIEWYDFTLYGLAAALVFAPLFFGGSELAGVLGAFATFAVGFFARPFGGLILSHYGDRLGRKGTLLVTLLLMGGASTLIGALPTYDQVGIWAPTSLILLRIIQGAGAGAEFAGAMTMSSESATTGRRAYTAGFPGAAVYVGMAIATCTFAILTSVMSIEAFRSWGWRLPFLASIVIVALALYFRMRVKETAAFETVEEEGAVSRLPLMDALRSQPGFILAGMGLFVFALPWVYVVQTFAVSYTTGTLNVDSTHALLGLIAAMVLTIPATLISGTIADRIGRKPLLMFAAVFGVVYAFPMFLLFETENSLLVAIGLVLGLAVVQGTTIGVSAAMIAELFPTRMRWSGIALCREIPAALAGGTAPFVATWLVSLAGGSPWLVAGYMVLLSLIGVIAVWKLPETLSVQST
ncbi:MULTISPECIES: MFS transporter [unclassified Brevibacterium]|uniref:MFS transporter n=1 Tax=unclassified Brevibacterium TaxID=2614124 RepID=UPI001092872C|nr:MFS transporter [Brevibacterium sp. S22]TGD30257.1 MFS transporter [Brevibacterium sp. S22]